MASNRADLVRELTAYLRRIGATQIRPDPSSDRPKVRFAWKGRIMTYMSPWTASAPRTIDNDLHRLRRMLGLTKRKKTVGERREKKRPNTPRPAVAENAPGGAVDWYLYQRQQETQRMVFQFEDFDFDPTMPQVARR